MNDQDKSRFVTNINWFNQFFGGIKQLFESVVEIMPNGFLAEDFALTSGSFHFPSQKFAPSIPPYYVLMLKGKQFALQVLAIFDAELFAKQGRFAIEPSIIVVLHSQADRYNYVEDYALRLIKNRGIEIAQQIDGKFWGKIKARLPADFFAFQVSFDKFSVDQNSRDAVREYIVDPIIEYLEKK
jgi:hypothetical protein